MMSMCSSLVVECDRVKRTWSMNAIEEYDCCMETRQLEYFVAVAEELSFTRAAERVHAVQSTVSAGIRSLEGELGARLFERDSQGVVLTPTGEEVLPAARSALEAVDLVHTRASPATGVRGRLRVGTFTSFVALDLPGVFGEYHARHPLVDLQLGPSTYGSSGLADDVRQGRVDAAFYGLPDAPAGLYAWPVAVSPFVAVLPEGHPLAGAGRVRLLDLAGERFIDSRPGFGNRVTLDGALAARGIRRRVETEVSDLGEIPRFVAARLGVAVMPQITVIPAAGAVTVPLEEQIEFRLSVISRVQQGAATRALFELLAERLDPAQLAG
jgi:DNA-binding transcriptional LysR family regulator